MQPDDVVDGPGLAGGELRLGPVTQIADGLAHLARERLDLAVQALFERRQPRLGRVEPVQRLVHGRQARFGDSRRLGVELTDRLLVRLADRRPLVLQAPLELVDPRRGLVQQAPLDLVPLAEATVELDDRRRVLLVVPRPAVEDGGAVARHLREPRFDGAQRLLRMTELLKGDGDLLDLNVKIGRAWLE